MPGMARHSRGGIRAAECRGKDSTSSLPESVHYCSLSTSERLFEPRGNHTRNGPTPPTPRPQIARICRVNRTRCSNAGVYGGACAIAISAQNLIEELAHRSFGLKYGISVVHCSGQIGICECDTTIGRAAYDFAGGRLAIAPKEKPRLRA